MRRAIPLLSLLLGGCPPPPEVLLGDTGAASGAPTIRVLYPPSGSTLSLGEDCRLSMVVVVDVENLDLVDPAQSAGLVAGEGHWHFETATNFLPSTQSFLEINGLEVPPNSTQRFVVSLQDNFHQPFDNPGSATNLELQIGPSPGGCP